MSWSFKFRIQQNIRGSLWLVPLLGVVLGVVLGFVDTQVDESIHLPSAWTYSPSTATTVLAAIVGAMAALTGFVVTVAVLVTQMAIGTFSARYMRIWYRDPMLKAVLAILVGTLAFAFSLLRRVETDFVPNLGVTISALLVLISLLMFLVFLDGYLHRLRPVAVAVLGTSYVRREFERLETVLNAPDVYAGESGPGGAEASWVVHSASAGAIQAIDVTGLTDWARRYDCIVVLHHRVGDFVPTNAPVIGVYGGGADYTPRQERTLRGMVALGNERTIDQDPAFAIRIIVDVAAKALSAAINDPTTAVQVLDQLAEVLRIVGTTHLEHRGLPAGDPRPHGLVIPMRSWEDYLALGVTEIRLYGASSIQVVRRMRAMLEQLHDEVPEQKRAGVAEELDRLDATVMQAFAQSVDRDRARTSDQEGMGGRPVAEPALRGRLG